MIRSAQQMLTGNPDMLAKVLDVLNNQVFADSNAAMLAQLKAMPAYKALPKTIRRLVDAKDAEGLVHMDAEQVHKMVQGVDLSKIQEMLKNIPEDSIREAKKHAKKAMKEAKKAMKQAQEAAK